MRIPLEKAEQCLGILLEGVSIRSIQRLTGLHQETILGLLVLAGERCEWLMSERIKGIQVKDAESDEIWGFVRLDTITKQIIGHADPRRICTSIVERSNLSIRTRVRRLTRLTNAFSKKWENLKAALALYFAYNNFCRIHSSIRCTSAMESGWTKRVWTIRELLTEAV